jgi:hypothetical protein
VRGNGYADVLANALEDERRVVEALVVLEAFSSLLRPGEGPGMRAKVSGRHAASRCARPAFT